MVEFYLCGRPGGCCPKVDIDGKTKLVTITDDYGGEIQMTLSEFKDLQKHDVETLDE